MVRKQEINFSPRFEVKVINEKLVIENKISYMDRIYPKNINNITVLLGKNGSGKTTILDILGMNRDDRCYESIKRKDRSRSEVVDSYFMLYHIQDDYFCIEVMDDLNQGDKITKLFKNNLSNFNFDELNGAFYKIPISLIIKKDNDNFQVVEHIFREYIPLGYKITEKVGVNYIVNTHSNRVNLQNYYTGKDEENYETDEYLFKRRYYLNPSIESQYKYINRMKCEENLQFRPQSVAIEIYPDCEYNLYPILENKEMEIWIENLEEALYIQKSNILNNLILNENDKVKKQTKTKTKKKYKDLFILDTLSRCIIYQFVKGVCDMIDDNNRKARNTHTGVNLDIYNNTHIQFLNNLKNNQYAQCNSDSILGHLVDKKSEYKNLIKVIEYYKRDKTLNDYGKLICISRYLYSRMESEIGLGNDSRYELAIEEFFNELNGLEEYYFNKKNIHIKCNSQIDEKLVKVFKIYDKYIYNQYSDLNMRFKIKILNLSEGEKNFLDLSSKIFDIVTKTEKNKLSIILLDEPDQSLHPEWSRRFIKYLCDEMKQYENKKIQIVLSTHSPFMVTDIMSEHVYCFENIKNVKEESKINICSMNKKGNGIHNTFGANIYEILKDSFTLEKTIGEFSYDIITQLINSLKDDLNDCDREFEKFLVNSIGERLLRKKLQGMYIKNRENCDKLKSRVIEQIKLETNEYKLNKIKEILSGDNHD
ncbi:ATP-binding protein [Clostridium sp. Sa3CVN1]|uniref:ATP-binding protein n=2 Tax=Clostridium cibarium TaxID=2762247 RepID=A0ABR8PPD9_9CLOT|nr:ATP-binding protein [Clostridium cibarium]